MSGAGLARGETEGGQPKEVFLGTLRGSLSSLRCWPACLTRKRLEVAARPWSEQAKDRLLVTAGSPAPLSHPIPTILDRHTPPQHGTHSDFWR